MKIILSEDKIYNFAKKYLEDELQGSSKIITKNNYFIQIIKDGWILFEIEHEDSERFGEYGNELGINRELYNTIETFLNNKEKTDQFFYDFAKDMFKRDFDYIYTFQEQIDESKKVKVVITESQIDRVVRQYLDSLFEISEINWTHPYDYDEESGVEGEDINRIEFYLGNYADGETCFRWASCDYFNKESPARDICPEVVIESPFDEQLNSYFGDLWEETFKKWFTENFQLPVKTVTTW